VREDAQRIVAAQTDGTGRPPPDHEAPAPLVKTVSKRISRVPKLVVYQFPSNAAVHGPAIVVSTSAKLSEWPNPPGLVTAMSLFMNVVAFPGSIPLASFTRARNVPVVKSATVDASGAQVAPDRQLAVM
jgi:hypothetical protein